MRKFFILGFSLLLASIAIVIAKVWDDGRGRMPQPIEEIIPLAQNFAKEQGLSVEDYTINCADFSEKMDGWNIEFVSKNIKKSSLKSFIVIIDKRSKNLSSNKTKTSGAGSRDIQPVMAESEEVIQFRENPKSNILDVVKFAQNFAEKQGRQSNSFYLSHVGYREENGDWDVIFESSFSADKTGKTSVRFVVEIDDETNEMHLSNNEEEATNQLNSKKIIFIRSDDFYFYFFIREGSRMHVHIRDGLGNYKFWIEPHVALAETKFFENTSSIFWAVIKGINASEKDKWLVRIQKLVESHKDEIVQAWHKHFKHE